MASPPIVPSLKNPPGMTLLASPHRIFRRIHAIAALSDLICCAFDTNCRFGRRLWPSPSSTNPIQSLHTVRPGVSFSIAPIGRDLSTGNTKPILHPRSSLDPATLFHRSHSARCHFMRTIQAPKRNSFWIHNIRQIVNLCRLLRRPSVTRSGFTTYVRSLNCAGYSGARKASPIPFVQFFFSLRKRPVDHFRD